MTLSLRLAKPSIYGGDIRTYMVYACTREKRNVRRKGNRRPSRRFIVYMRHEQGYWKVWLPAGLIRRVFESCGSEGGTSCSPFPRTVSPASSSSSIESWPFLAPQLSRKLILRLYTDVDPARSSENDTPNPNDIQILYLEKISCRKLASNLSEI